MKTGVVNTHLEAGSANAEASGLSRWLPDSGPERLFGMDFGSDGDTGNLDPSVKRILKQLALLLICFFTAIALITVIFVGNRYAATAKNDALTATAELSGKIDATLSEAVAWTDTALQASTPTQIVAIASRGKNAAAAAYFDASGRLLAASPLKAGDALASARPDAKMTPGDIQIRRIVAENGDVNPVVVRAHTSGQLIYALGLNQLAPSLTGVTALVSPTGLVVDGTKGVASRGPLESLGLDTIQLSRLTNRASSSTSESWKHNGESYWLTAVRVPNSDLTLIQLHPRKGSPYTLSLLFIFAGLFAGTCILLSAMLKQAFDTLRRQRTSYEADEVARQRYQAAVESTGGGIFEIDLKDNTVFLSKPLVHVLNLGGTESELPLAQFLGLFHDTSREQFYSLMRRAHMTGEFEIDVQVRHLPIVLSCQGKPTLRSEQDNDIPTRKVIVGVAHDVTEQRGAQARLRAAETRLFDALRSMSDAFVVWDPLDRLVLWNSRFEDFFGFRPGNLHPGLDRATVDYHAQAAVEDTSAMDEGSVTEIKLKDGRWLRYIENATEDGGRVSIATDVTEIRQREELVLQNNEVLEHQYDTLRKTQTQLLNLARNYEREKIRAEEANQSKSEFLANMSHELRTPLNAINGFSDIMQKEMFGPLGDPRYKEYVNDILFSGKHLLSLINDILDMSKIEAGKMTLNTDTVSVSSLVEQVVRIVRGRAEENRLRLIYTPTPSDPIEADPRAVKQVLLNLISNAIKFTPEGGIVRVDLETKQTGVIVRVSDSGMGISEDDLKRLAQPFEQASNNKSGEGTGLGLALSKSLIELHGGNFHIASELGKGTTITFTLPNRPVPADRTVAKPGVSEEISRLATTISAALEQGREVGAQPEASQSPAPSQEAPQPSVPQPVPYVPPAA